MTYRSDLSAIASARHAALARLIAAHDEEFEHLLADERAQRGLHPRTRSAEVEHLRRRIAELEEALRG